MNADVREVIVIGGAAAGYTAALYTARANMAPLVIEGVNWGGQLMITSDVENYPGYPGGVLGPRDDAGVPQAGRALRRRVHHRRRDQGRFLRAPVPRLGRRRRVPRRDGHRRHGRERAAARARVRALAPGPRRLVLRGLRRGVLPRQGRRGRGRRRLGDGGGHLPRASSRRKVTVVHRRDVFRASPIMVDRAQATDKIEFVTDSVVEEVLGRRPRHRRPRSQREDRRDDRHPRRGLLRRDRPRPDDRALQGPARHGPESGYLVTKGKTTETNVPGVFAAGDVQDDVYRQAVTAAGSGCMAALDAERWLAAERGHLLDALAAPRS